MQTIPAPTLRAAALLLLVTLAACGGGGGGGGVPAAPADALQALASADPLAAAPACTAAAVRIRLGLDANRNGSLDADEVSYTEVVCTGAGGMLMSLVDEPAGATCAAGGKRLLAGADANGDGVLQAAEASSSAYVCHGTQGPQGPQGPAGVPGGSGAASLMSITAEPAGAHCAAAGSRVQSGIDGNGNGTLDPPEVVQTAYVCHGAQGTPGSPGGPGADGRTSLLLTTPEPAGANCTYGGTRVQNGVDANASGTLDAAEVAQTAYVCNPSPAGLAWVEVGADHAAAPNTGYVHTGTASIRITLPQAPAVGSIVRVVGAGTGAWTVRAAGTEVIRTANLPVPLRWGPAWVELAAATSPTDVAISGDGRYLILASANQPLWISSDHGQTWQPRGSARDWRTVALSADGRTMFAAGDGTGIHVSRDWGATWAENGPAGSWRKVASSADGTRVAVAGTIGVLTNMLLISGDGGTNWAPTALPDTQWNALAVSGSGSVVVAGGSTGPLFISRDGGANWTAYLAGGNFTAAATSYDGRAFVVARQGGSGATLHESTDEGLGWTSQSLGTVGRAVAMSHDGRRRAWATAGGLFMSGEPGAAWADVGSPTGDITSVACTSDCARVVALKAGVPRLFGSRTTTTTPGGELQGAADGSIELQYLGNGAWAVLGYSGWLAAR